MAVTTQAFSDSTGASGGGLPLSTEIHEVLWGTTSDVTATLTTKLKKLVGPPVWGVVGTVDEVTAHDYQVDVGYTSGMSVALNTGADNLAIRRAAPVIAGSVGAASVRTVVRLFGVG